jgi:hypothetical protein
MVKKETFETWVKDNNWLQINEALTTNGRQVTYLSPAGDVTIAIYNLKGELEQIAKTPIPVIPISMNVPRSPIDLRGGLHLPQE